MVNYKLIVRITQRTLNGPTTLYPETGSPSNFFGIPVPDEFVDYVHELSAQTFHAASTLENMSAPARMDWFRSASDTAPIGDGTVFKLSAALLNSTSTNGRPPWESVIGGYSRMVLFWRSGAWHLYDTFDSLQVRAQYCIEFIATPAP